MTVIMTFVGTLVFMFSWFTVGYKAAVKRLFMFIATGVLIDCCIIAVAIFVAVALSN